jgi:GDP/UDP-N,N'-diacetylbacillosamine 2-epimerase (hydrolysing)
MRKVLGVTGIRSEYDIMSSVFQAIDDRDDLELELIVTGAHLSDTYGHTIDEIEADGFSIADRIPSLIESDSLGARVSGLGAQLIGMVETVERVQPDFLLVLGDREESMSTALVGAYMNVPVAHIAGGDRVVGNVDDQVRHAVTKLAHLHFVTNGESAERIRRLGEQAFRIFDFGNPGLDRLVAEVAMSKEAMIESLGLPIGPEDPVILLIQHVISTESEHGYAQMAETLEAVRETGIQTVLSYPNSDAGSGGIIRAIDECRDMPNLAVFENIPRAEFVGLMKSASCLLGNSSAGILEAPVLGLPVINVGNRQKGRLHAENVEFVPHEHEVIAAALRRAVFDEDYRRQVARCSNPYGDGTASQRIAATLATINCDDDLLIKDITY